MIVNGFYDSGRIAGDKHIIRKTFGHDRSCPNNYIIAYGYSRTEGGIATYPNIISNRNGFCIFQTAIPRFVF